MRHDALWSLCVATAAAIRQDVRFTRRTASVAGLTSAAGLAVNPHGALASGFGTEEQQEINLERDYRQKPLDVSGVAVPLSFRGERDVVLIFHGRGGEDRETELTRAAVVAEDQANNVTRPVEIFNWERWVDPSPDRLFLGAADVGATLGRALAADGRLRTLHIIGEWARGQHVQW